MAKFCTKCGTPLVEGEVHICAAKAAPPTAPKRPVPPPGTYPAGSAPMSSTPRTSAPNPNAVPRNAVPNSNRTAAPAPNAPRNPAAAPNPNAANRPSRPVASTTKTADGKESVNINVNQISSTASGIWTAFKNQIGIGDPLINQGDAFERGKRIVPDCVKPNDSEIPVRQYKIATLKNRFLGIPYMKAQGRIQVTNKRVIFRAPGRCIAGRTTLQHEFAIDEIAGIESRREFVFTFWDLIIGLLVFLIGGSLSSGIALLFSRLFESAVPAYILSFIFSGASYVAFFMIKKQWLFKLFALGAGVVPMALLATGELAYSYAMSGESGFLSGFMMVLMGVALILALFTLFIYSIRPNLALIIKTKSASEAIDIRRKKENLFAIFGLGGQNEKDDHTGYREILPEKDAEITIREIGAMINDIQKLGDHGIEKWRR